MQNEPWDKGEATQAGRQRRDQTHQPVLVDTFYVESHFFSSFQRSREELQTGGMIEHCRTKI